MIKKFIFFIILSFSLISCDYSPIYSSNNNYDFYIENIYQEGNSEINTLIRSKLKKYQKVKNTKKFTINNFSTFKKSSQSKNKSGNTDQYLLDLKVKFVIKSEGDQKSFLLEEKFIMKNFENEFDEKNYERTIKDNMTKLVVDNLMLQLTRMQ